MPDFNPGRDEIEDVAAMKREGDLGAYLRGQIRAARDRRTKPAPTPAPRPPGHRPGAWPTGTSPPGPLPDRGADWTHALDRYRSGQGSDRDPCHCGGCPHPDKTTEEKP